MKIHSLWLLNHKSSSLWIVYSIFLWKSTHIATMISPMIKRFLQLFLEDFRTFTKNTAILHRITQNYAMKQKNVSFVLSSGLIICGNKPVLISYFAKTRNLIVWRGVENDQSLRILSLQYILTPLPPPRPQLCWPPRSLFPEFSGDFDAYRLCFFKNEKFMNPNYVWHGIDFVMSIILPATDDLMPFINEESIDG